MSINPDLQLGSDERAYLTQLCAMPGYKVLHNLMRSEVDKFVVAMINADPKDKDDVLAKQVLMKASAQFYQGITNRVNEEVTLYTAAPRADDKPIDATEGVLDLGQLAEQLDDVPNILGGE